MTNAESYQLTATKALNAKLLDAKEQGFIEQIKDYDKRRLKKLTSLQFNWLRDIASKFENVNF